MQVILIKLRKQANETQEQLANLLGINVASYRNKETGDTQFKMDEMFIIANHFNKSIEDVFLPKGYTTRDLKEKTMN